MKDLSLIRTYCGSGHSSLRAATAKKDAEKIAKAINTAVSAAKAVDKVVKLGIDLLA
jgi:hypothetical protein